MSPSPAPQGKRSNYVNGTPSPQKSPARDEKKEEKVNDNSLYGKEEWKTRPAPKWNGASKEDKKKWSKTIRGKAIQDIGKLPKEHRPMM